MSEATHLRTVRDDESEDDFAPRPASQSGLPQFEGQDVDLARIKLASASDLEIDEGGGSVHIDDIVRLLVEGRVTRIDHVVDAKTGRLTRVQTVKVIEASSVSWNTDPQAL